MPAVQVHGDRHRQVVAVGDHGLAAAAGDQRRAGERPVVAEDAGAQPGQDLLVRLALDDLVEVGGRVGAHRPGDRRDRQRHRVRAGQPDPAAHQLTGLPARDRQGEAAEAGRAERRESERAEDRVAASPRTLRGRPARRGAPGAAGASRRPARNSHTVTRIWPTVSETPSGRCTTSTRSNPMPTWTSTASAIARLAQIGHARPRPSQK